MVNTLAFDLGASSGRAVVGSLEGDHLSIVDTHRFPNEPVHVQGHMYWDILRLFHEIKQGLIATRLKGYTELQSIGIDTWAVDFGLLDINGDLLGNPYHYRDPQTDGIMEALLKRVPRSELFQQTGIQFLPFNTIYQLIALKQNHSPLLTQARTLLLIPELLRYFLTGKKISEWTVASTSQLCNPFTATWDHHLIEYLELPHYLFLKPQQPGSPSGTILPEIAAEVGYCELPVIAVAEHDTASAVIAVPAQEKDFAYLSCGTWSLLGTEVAAPVINQQALELNITNEGGINGSSRLLKNVTGLWLIQECRRIWRNEGLIATYEEEQSAIQKAEPFQSLINPDDPMFIHPIDMPQQIQKYCSETNQVVPQSPGALLRCIIESLALRYRFVLEQIEILTQKDFRGLHMVGGGAQNAILCQYTANALKRPVWAGPFEGTAIGNLLVQFLASGHIRDMQHARSIVRNSFSIETYEPTDTEVWEQAYRRFCTLFSA
ncbi:rhamnulokinase [Tengunoibacter tsumagoiensis]|uniref:Rhamnulokinase n=1 Tax=Tengunoibacter tsumagoiensis TaxID=2014871 RepID=A0A402A155_9CHLR|nr:rhamnulokinase family protein [Tengunoibacter tsumagoiensis]GCE12878.1 rhamnulokinase [Tengunoibacter tsumagoiensis]